MDITCSTTIIKTSLGGIGFRDSMLPRLEQFVHSVNIIKEHTYMLARWILLHQLADDDTFDPATFVKKGFFRSIYLFIYHNLKAKAVISAEDFINQKDRPELLSADFC
ncbi:hypothetical protein DL89DRAFT_267298, partial [Linderina pennispora]